MSKGDWSRIVLSMAPVAGHACVHECGIRPEIRKYSRTSVGKDAVASHLYLQVSLALGEFECACPSTEIWLKHRLWVCRPGLGPGTLHFSELYWSCWCNLYTESTLRRKDLGDVPAGRQSNLPHLAGMFIFSGFPCILLSRQDLRVTVL